MSLKPTGINSTLFPKKDKKHVEDAGAPVARDLSDGGDSDTLQHAQQLQSEGKIILVDWAEVSSHLHRSVVAKGRGGSASVARR